MKQPSSPIVVCVAILLALPGIHASHAGSATWNQNPASSDWNTAANWTPATVPNGPADIAEFGVSNTADVAISANVEVNSVQFDPGASAFAITVPPNLILTVSGAGVINNSGVTQNFAAAFDGLTDDFGAVHFTNTANAGAAVVYTNNGEILTGDSDGGTQFFDGSSAGSATFVNTGPSARRAFAGQTVFHDSSTAANATFINTGGTARFGGGFVSFQDNSTADNAVINNIGSEINASRGGGVGFGDNATAGNAIVNSFASDHSGAEPALIGFSENATAGDATFRVQGTRFNGGAGTQIYFRDESSAGDATFDLGGSAASNIDDTCAAFFYGTSTAADSTFILGGGDSAGGQGAYAELAERGSFGNATVIVEGGTNGGLGGFIRMLHRSSGGTARLELLGNSYLDISLHHSPGVSFGSLEGSGSIFLGANNLTVGGTNQRFEFSGVIQDGGFSGGFGGSFTKTGAGVLTLSGASTYTGQTVLEGGTLILNNTTGSATGTGDVLAKTGFISGRGTVSGSLAVGTGGAGIDCHLSPGGNMIPATMRVGKALLFQSDGTYDVLLNSETGVASMMIATNTQINRAFINLTDTGTGVLAAGTTLTLIANSSPTPIAGTFANLPDGGTVTVGKNTFQANYEGGDGNDLTLTVQ